MWVLGNRPRPRDGEYESVRIDLYVLWQVFTIVTIRPVYYSKFVLPSRKSLEIIINIKKYKIKI